MTDDRAWHSGPAGEYTVEVIGPEDGTEAVKLIDPRGNMLALFYSTKDQVEAIATTLNGGLPEGHPAREALQNVYDATTGNDIGWTIADVQQACKAALTIGTREGDGS